MVAYKFQWLLLTGAVIALLAFADCNNKKVEISDFEPLSNFKFQGDTLDLPMDLDGAVLNGISIPSNIQSPGGYFKFSFNIRNNTGQAAEFFYKIFYQNESYKYPEFKEVDGKRIYNPKSSENFYGSWISAADTFHKTPMIPSDGELHKVVDSFRIQGNPRDEEQFFGPYPGTAEYTSDEITSKVNSIKNTPEWLRQVAEKAKNNGVGLEDQLREDALWVLKDDAIKKGYRSRWKRNPRTGSYSFLLVAGLQSAISTVPPEISKIDRQTDSTFVNPYYRLLYSDSSKNDDLIIIRSSKVLKTYARFDLDKGIYYNRKKFPGDIKPVEDMLNANCNCYSKLYDNAEFEQFFHSANAEYKFKNVPVISDVSNDYTKLQYNENKEKYSFAGLISDYVRTTQHPCKTVSYDDATKNLIIKSPGNAGTFIKENVGVNSRIGFTYGKFIAKVRFPATISKDNVWNGITCAYWLLYQSDEKWNKRSVCEGSGYIPKSIVGETKVREKSNVYSEIDFEILKTSEYWPATSYKGKTTIPKDDPANDHNIIVACTNWDLACRMPKKFSIGATDFYDPAKNKYVVHRWDDWYKALTIKHAENHDSIFNRPYYYEIEWTPEWICWRIGPSKDKMKLIAYMDNTITTIPDNQMIIVFSQEFHDSKWWPLSPFVQDMIPFPKNDIKTEIMEMWVE